MLRWQYYVTAVSRCPLVSHHPDGLFCSSTWSLVLCSCCLISSFTWIFFSDSYPFEYSWCHIWTCALGWLTLPMPTHLSESFRKTEPLWRLWNKTLDYRHKDLTGQSSGNKCPKRELVDQRQGFNRFSGSTGRTSWSLRGTLGSQAVPAAGMRLQNAGEVNCTVLPLYLVVVLGWPLISRLSVEKTWTWSGGEWTQVGICWHLCFACRI